MKNQTFTLRLICKLDEYKRPALHVYVTTAPYARGPYVQDSGAHTRTALYHA